MLIIMLQKVSQTKHFKQCDKYRFPQILQLFRFDSIQIVNPIICLKKNEVCHRYLERDISIFQELAQRQLPKEIHTLCLSFGLASYPIRFLVVPFWSMIIYKVSYLSGCCYWFGFYVMRKTLVHLMDQTRIWLSFSRSIWFKSTASLDRNLMSNLAKDFVLFQVSDLELYMWFSKSHQKSFEWSNYFFLQAESVQARQKCKCLFHQLQ